ncbi:hypothetical protein KQX54_009112 [Cotesia glomerata]|uniref:Uncharacterized protein n=1 Tax=Cotesia glomerata TaxID=32391 RepID=A0AAV7IGR3_COTGL|nr:hypothetical protein KQX54_009112 [Cotesia glomerata]
MSPCTRNKTSPSKWSRAVAVMEKEHSIEKQYRLPRAFHRAQAQKLNAFPVSRVVLLPPKGNTRFKAIFSDVSGQREIKAFTTLVDKQTLDLFQPALALSYTSTFQPAVYNLSWDLFWLILYSQLAFNIHDKGHRPDKNSIYKCTYHSYISPSTSSRLSDPITL